jgi:hypothetical protein
MRQREPAVQPLGRTSGVESHHAVPVHLYLEMRPPGPAVHDRAFVVMAPSIVCPGTPGSGSPDQKSLSLHPDHPHRRPRIVAVVHQSLSEVSRRSGAGGRC